MDKPKDEPEMIHANTCKQCGFDLRLPPECTLEVWEQLHDERDDARTERDQLREEIARLKDLHQHMLDGPLTTAQRECHQLRAERDDAVQALLAILAPLEPGQTRVHGDGCFCDQCIADACLARLPRAGEGGKMSQGCKHGHLPPCTECARDEEIAVWQDRAAINGKEAFRIIDERDQLRAERDLAVEALQTIDKAPGTYRGNLLVIARKALARLPRAGERARIVADVLMAARRIPEGWGISDKLAALDAFDRAQGGGKQ